MTKIIAITGVDGAGKSTIVDSLSNKGVDFTAKFVHKNRNENVRLVSQWHARPFGSKRDWCEGTFSRDVGFAAALDFVGHFNDVISPLLGQVPFVICDRYWHCFAAYLLATGHDRLVDDLFDRIPNPALIIHITVADKLLAARYRARGGAGEDEFPELMAKFENGYQALFRTIDSPVVQIDNSGPIEDTLARIRSALEGPTFAISGRELYVGQKPRTGPVAA